MPRDGYESVSVPVEDYDKAQDYKPDDVTWGDCLVAGADRLSDMQGTDMAGRVDAADGIDAQAFVDDLVSQLPPRIAEEMEGRLR